MTHYAVDADRSRLVCLTTLPTGIVVGDVATLRAVSDDASAELAASLTTLANALWPTYTEPVTTAAEAVLDYEDGIGADSADGFELIAAAIRSPNFPDRGYVLQSYNNALGAAHEIGRTLNGIADDTLRDSLVTEIQEEAAAVEQAELGNYTDRAAQAVLLTKAAASPPQVAAAFDLLLEIPFGSARLLAETDPHAACVAAAHFLLCATEVASKASGIAVRDIIIEAENLEAVDVEAPALSSTCSARSTSPTTSSRLSSAEQSYWPTARSRVVTPHPSTRTR